MSVVTKGGSRPLSYHPKKHPTLNSHGCSCVQKDRNCQITLYLLVSRTGNDLISKQTIPILHADIFYIYMIVWIRDLPNTVITDEESARGAMKQAKMTVCVTLLKARRLTRRCCILLANGTAGNSTLY